MPGLFGLEFYKGDAYYGATQLDFMGVATPGHADYPWSGQSQQPFVTTADPGIPITFSCSSSAVVTPPLPVYPGTEPVLTWTETTGGASTTTLTGGVVIGANDFNTVAGNLIASGVIGALGGSTVVRITSGLAPPAGANGMVVDITAQTQTTLTLADPVTIAPGDTFQIDLVGTATGPPFPQGVNAALCPNGVGNLTGLPVERGYDLAASPGVTQLTAFVAAYTTVGTPAFPLTSPVFSPLDMRLDEVVDTDSDGIPDRHDNCVSAPNGPLAGAGCYSVVDGNGVPQAGPPYPNGVKFIQQDTDGDGNGDTCDGDFSDDGAVNSTDVVILNADLVTGVPTPGTGTDMNCDGAVNSTDSVLYNPQAIQGAPGASGLWCAGAGTPAAPCTF